MPEYSSFPSFYDPSSVRAIVTPSAFARQNLFFLQYLYQSLQMLNMLFLLAHL